MSGAEIVECFQNELNFSSRLFRQALAGEVTLLLISNLSCVPIHLAGILVLNLMYFVDRPSKLASLVLNLKFRYSVSVWVNDD